MTQSDFWEKLKTRLRDVSTAAADFTEEQAMIGKLKFEVLNIKRKIEKLHRDIGVRVLELSKLDPTPNPFEDSDVTQLISEINGLEEQIDLKHQEIDKVAAHFRTKATARERAVRTDNSRSTQPKQDTTSTPKKSPVVTAGENKLQAASQPAAKTVSTPKKRTGSKPADDKQTTPKSGGTGKR